MIYRFRKEDLEGQLNRNALWAIVYGDLMSYLMILFLLMLSFTLSEKLDPQHKNSKAEEAYIEVIRVFGGELTPDQAAAVKNRDMNAVLEKKLQEAADLGELGEGVKIVITERRITINLEGGVLFDSGKADLKPAAVEIIGNIARNLVNRENEIRVEGHTDNVPIKSGQYKSNWELSMARAYVVLKTLQEGGLNPKRLSGIGYGEHRPIADNKTRAGRIQNRRIEISLLREQ